MITKTTYMSNEQAGAVIVDQDDSVGIVKAISLIPAGVNYHGQLVVRKRGLLTTSLRRVDSPPNSVTTFMLGIFRDAYDIEVGNISRQISGRLINFFYGNISYAGSPVIINDPDNPEFYLIQSYRPTLNRDKWKQSQIIVFGIGCEIDPKQWGSPTNIDVGDFDIPDLFDHVVTPHGMFSSPLNSNSICPGELICQRWTFKDINETHIVDNRSTGVIWTPGYFSGGYITSIVGQYSDFDLKYTVQLMNGHEYRIPPSDHFHWEVGDYVFYSTSIQGTIGENINFILPVKVDGKGREDGLKEFGTDLKMLQETQFFGGILYAFNRETARGSVAIDEFESLVNLEFFYHSPDGNINADVFHNDDQVLVCKIDGVYKIIGHTDGLHNYNPGVMSVDSVYYGWPQDPPGYYTDPSLIRPRWNWGSRMVYHVPGEDRDIYTITYYVGCYVDEVDGIQRLYCTGYYGWDETYSEYVTVEGDQTIVMEYVTIPGGHWLEWFIAAGDPAANLKVTLYKEHL